MSQVNFIPGQHSPAGFDVNGDGRVDVTMNDLAAAAIRRPRGQEVRTLNQYTGYFSTSEGDYPVSVVANSMKEAAKILTMPGVFGAESLEPTMIKYVKGSVAVSVPVHMVGFTTVVTPSGAVDSGAYATPEHATVNNGTDVIFSAYEPFGWKFDGWYKGDPDNGGTLISKDKISTIDVYDAYSTLVTYFAKYTFSPNLRNGRYMDVSNGWTWDIDFDGYSSYKGRVSVIASNLADYHFVISDLKVDADANGTMTLIPDPTVTQIGGGENGVCAQITFTPSYVGLNMVIKTITMPNLFGFENDTVCNLKWVGPVNY
ncbi:MAG: hypothetical protein HUJ68_12150 [Clostridia bacterium]|nr:hypothetical protein [Clostridia bacterium]